MRETSFALGIGFALGCIAGGLLEPPSRARTQPQRPIMRPPRPPTAPDALPPPPEKRPAWQVELELLRSIERPGIPWDGPSSDLNVSQALEQLRSLESLDAEWLEMDCDRYPCVVAAISDQPLDLQAEVGPEWIVSGVHFRQPDGRVGMAFALESATGPDVASMELVFDTLFLHGMVPGSSPVEPEDFETLESLAGRLR